MRLGIKVALSTLCVVSLLFGVCGGVLISLSFQSSLTREKSAARESYEALMETLSAMESVGAFSSKEEMAESLGKLSGGDASGWEALRVVSDDEVLYDKGDMTRWLASLGDAPGSLRHADLDAGQAAMQTIGGEGPSAALMLSGACVIDGATVYIDAMRGIYGIYVTREDQMQAFRFAFGILVGATALLATASAFILTRPLSKLSGAAYQIARGRLSSRSNVRTDDEVGSLSRDFDTMAAQIEHNIELLRDSLARQQRFMGSFAHEMKTPMTSVIGYADLLRRGMLEGEEGERAAQYVFDEGRRLEALSTKLLELFVLDGCAGPFVDVDVHKLVESAAAPLVDAWREQGILLRWRSDEGTCLMDPDLARSLLVNLLENARRATSDSAAAGAASGNDAVSGAAASGAPLETRGAVRPEVRIWCKMQGSGCVIAVADNGRGIERDDLARLTEEFYRVDKSRSRAFGGAGLGLSLCARIMEAHGGDLRIESTPGKGTRVSAFFPGIAPQPAPSSHEAASVLENMETTEERPRIRPASMLPIETAGALKDGGSKTSIPGKGDVGKTRRGHRGNHATGSRSACGRPSRDRGSIR